MQCYDQDNYCIIRQATDRVVGVTLISSDLRAWRAALTSDPVVRHGVTAEDEHASSLRSDTAHVVSPYNNKPYRCTRICYTIIISRHVIII